MLCTDYFLIKPFKSFFPFCFCLDIAFPDSNHFPSGKTEVNIVGIVTGYIHGYFVSPEVNVRFRQSEIFASLMTMPKATVDENNRLIFLQHNVRRSGQFTVVDTIAQTTREKYNRPRHPTPQSKNTGTCFPTDGNTHNNSRQTPGRL